jgi:adenine-specific DNA-methyltransferase
MARKPKSPTEITSIRHTKNTRVNIPTEELRDFVADDEKAPKAMLYPRDPSLDPQLVWNGKDEQDQAALEVPVVPIYIQEKVHPQALVENLRDTAKADAALGNKEPELTLFDDFNGMDDATFDKKVDFYHHDNHWSNRMILGDSLLVMTSLAEKEGLKGKVQTIYFDPPYGIKFGSNWQVSTRKRDVKDGKAEDATRQPEQVRAFRDTWKLGIHSYLGYLRDRLTIARDLLTENGSIFVQIGDENVHLVRSVLDEVVGGAGGGEYRRVLLLDGSVRSATDEELGDQTVIPINQRLCRIDNLTSPRVREGRTGYYPIKFAGRTFLPAAGEWKTNREGIQRLEWAGRLYARSGSLGYIRVFSDFPVFAISSSWTDTAVAGRPGDKLYVVQTSSKVVDRALLMTTDPGDLVLDPTCGSGTTAYAAEQWGRRWITIDTSRVAVTLARTALDGRQVSVLPARRLAGRREEGSRSHRQDSAGVQDRRRHPQRLRLQARAARHAEVDREQPGHQRGMSRAEIDAAISRYADTEMLFDKPYEDNKRIRVSGPFTVESLSPHRVLATDEERPSAEREGQRDTAVQFEQMILGNLRKAGVQNTVKNERLVFTRLEPHPGQWIQAAGEYIDADGKPRRVAVSIGPEHGTVGPQQVKEAAKEAVQGAGFDILIVCGFARVRRSEALRQAHGSRRADESRSVNGRRTVEEDRRRQPLHGVRRAGHQDHNRRGRRQPHRRGPRRGRLRSDDGADPQQLDGRHRLLVHRHGL